MYLTRKALLNALCCGLFAVVLAGDVQAQTDFLYITDYGGGNLDRYSFNYNSLTHTISGLTPDGLNGSTTNAVFIAGGIKEGIQGTHNDIIVVATGGNSLVRYDLNGHVIGAIPILTSGGSPYTLNGVGNVIITPDGKFMYVPEATAGKIDKIDMLTGKIVTSVNFAGAHDILLGPDGTLYAAAYTGSNSGSSGVWTFDSNLGSKTQLIASGNNGLTAPTGLSMKGSVLYVNQNVAPTSANSVYEYSIGSAGPLHTATFLNHFSSANLQFIFGSDFGPDGNLYIASLGGASGRNDPGHTDGVYEFNTTTDVTSLFIAGEPGTSVNANGPAGPSGLYSPKYLQFGTNFISANDPGAPAIHTPEPGTVALFCSFAVAGAGWRRRRKRQ